MLLSLKKIYGIGKYAHFDGNVELSKNQVFLDLMDLENPH